MGVDSPKIRPLCPTRWTVRTEAINSVLKNYTVFQEAFSEVAKNCRDEHGSKASGILSKLQEFATFFGLKLSFTLFSVSESFSKMLQDKQTSIESAVSQAEIVLQHFSSLRNDAEFNQFYEKSVSESENLTDPPALPRKRRLPRKYDEKRSQHVFTEPIDMHRVTYFNVLDVIVTELEKRMSKASLNIPLKIENLLLNCLNLEQHDSEELSSVCSFFGDDISETQLQQQLCMLPNMIEVVKKEEKFKTLKKVTKLSTLCEIFAEKEKYSALFPDIVKLLQILLTIPVSTASAERSFSALRRLKTYLRSTMAQERLNSVIVLNCHKDLTDHIDLISVAQDFVSKHQARRNFFGCFKN